MVLQRRQIGVVWERRDQEEEQGGDVVRPARVIPPAAGRTAAGRARGMLAAANRAALAGWRLYWDQTKNYVAAPELRAEVEAELQGALDRRRAAAARRARRARDPEVRAAAQREAERLQKRVVSQLEIDIATLAARGRRLAWRLAPLAAVVAGPVVLVDAGVWQAVMAWPLAWGWLAVRGATLAASGGSVAPAVGGRAAARLPATPAATLGGESGGESATPDGQRDDEPATPGDEPGDGAATPGGEPAAGLPATHAAAPGGRQGNATATPGDAPSDEPATPGGRQNNESATPAVGAAPPGDESGGESATPGGPWATTTAPPGGAPAMAVAPPPLTTRQRGAPHAVIPIGPPTTSPLVGQTRPLNLWRDPVVWGVDATGAPVASVLPGQPGLLIGGVSGSGKSVAAHNVLCAAALDPHVQLWLVDGKRVELTYYRGIAHRYLGEPDVAAFSALVQELVDEKNRRLQAIEGRAVKLTAENWRRFGMPPIILHIDEMQIYTLQGRAGQDAATQLALLASQCRAVGIFVSVATQRPTAQVVPPLLANNLTLKLALRCEDASQSNTVLGDGMAGRGYRADRFTADQHGAAYYRGEVGLPVALRTSYLHIPDEGEDGEDHVRAIIRRAAGWRRDAGTLPARNAPVRDTRIVRAALAALDRLGTDRATREVLARELDMSDDALRGALRRAGVCAPRTIRCGDVTGRGWHRRDLEAALSQDAACDVT